MRIRWVVAAVAALAALSACAGTKEAKKDVASVTPGVDQSQEGVVTQVGDGSMQVQLAQDGGKQVTFNKTQKTEVRRGDDTVSWSDIGEGEAVRVSYEPETGPEAAKKVEILTGDEASQVKSKASQAGQPPAAWPRPDSTSPGSSPPEPTEPTTPPPAGGY